MEDLRIALSFCLAASLLTGCAPMGSRHAEAAPADSIAIAYVSGDCRMFADFRSYRNDYTVRTELSSLDLGMRQNDFSVEEVGPESFPALRSLGADPNASPEALRGLRCGPNRVLVVLAVPVDGNGRSSGRTMTADIAHNILAVGAMVATAPYSGDFRPDLQHTAETGHGFRAILFDKTQGRILLDTVSTVLTQGARAPGQGRDENPVEWHYRTFVKACVKGR